MMTRRVKPEKLYAAIDGQGVFFLDQLRVVQLINRIVADADQVVMAHVRQPRMAARAA